MEVDSRRDGASGCFETMIIRGSLQKNNTPSPRPCESDVQASVRPRFCPWTATKWGVQTFELLRWIMQLSAGSNGSEWGLLLPHKPDIETRIAEIQRDTYACTTSREIACKQWGKPENKKRSQPNQHRTCTAFRNKSPISLKLLHDECQVLDYLPNKAVQVSTCSDVNWPRGRQPACSHLATAIRSNTTLVEHCLPEKGTGHTAPSNPLPRTSPRLSSSRLMSQPRCATLAKVCFHQQLLVSMTKRASVQRKKTDISFLHCHLNLNLILRESSGHTCHAIQKGQNVPRMKTNQSWQRRNALFEPHHGTYLGVLKQSSCLQRVTNARKPNHQQKIKIFCSSWKGCSHKNTLERLYDVQYARRKDILHLFRLWSQNRWWDNANSLITEHAQANRQTGNALTGKTPPGLMKWFAIGQNRSLPDSWTAITRISAWRLMNHCLTEWTRNGNCAFARNQEMCTKGTSKPDHEAENQPRVNQIFCLQ